LSGVEDEILELEEALKQPLLKPSPGESYDEVIKRFTERVSLLNEIVKKILALLKEKE